MVSPYLHGDQIRYEVLAHASVDVGSTPVGLPNIPGGDLRAQIKRTVIRAVDGQLFWTGDGTDPTGPDAFPAEELEIFVYDGSELDLFQMVSAVGTVDVRVIYMC